MWCISKLGLPLCLLLIAVSCSKSGSSPGAPASTSTTRLSLRQTVPPDGARDLAPDTVFGAAFSASLDPESVTSDSFRLLRGDDDVPGRIRHRGRDLFFEPDRLLRDRSEYRLVLGQGLRSVEGARLEGPITIGFRTGIGEAFRLVRQVPSEGADSVRADARVRAELSLEIDPASVQPDSLVLRTAGQIVPGTTSVRGELLVLIPNQELGSEVDYTVSLSGSIRDRAGRELGADRLWSFRTRETVPPTVIRFTPEPGASDIERSVVVEAELSEDVRSGTVREDTFRLLREGSPVEARVQYEDRVARLTPARPIRQNSTFTAVLSNQITDHAGNPLARTEWSFETRIEGLDPADLIEDDDTGHAEEPVIAASGSERAIALWTQVVPTGGDSYRSIFARAFDPSRQQWDAVGPLLVDDWGLDHCQSPRVAMDTDGNAIAVWRQVSRSYGREWPQARRWDGDLLRWEPETVQLSESNDIRCDELEIAIDGHGDALAVWRQQLKDQPLTIWSRRYDVSSGSWQPPSQLSYSDGSNIPQDLTVAGRPNRGFFVAWEAVDSGGHTDLLWSRFDVGWSAPELLEEDSRPARDVSIAVAGNGDAFFSFSLETLSGDGLVYDDLVARRWRDGQFDRPAPRPIDILDDRSVRDVSLAADAAGNAIVIWRQAAPDAPGRAGEESLWTRRYSIADDAWLPGVPERLSYEDLSDVGCPSLAMRPDGRAWAIWQQRDLRGEAVALYGASRDPADGWSDPRYVSSDSPAPLRAARMTTGQEGAALVIWPELGTKVFSLWGVRFP